MAPRLQVTGDEFRLTKKKKKKKKERKERKKKVTQVRIVERK